MRFFVLYSLYGLVAIALQTTWLLNVPWKMASIDLIFLAVITLSLSEEWHQALPMVVLFGMLVDSVSGSPFGVSVLSFSAIYFSVRVLSSHVTFDPGLGRFFWIAAMSAFEKMICFLTVVSMTGDLSSFRVWMSKAIPQAFFDGATGFFFVSLLKGYGNLSLAQFIKPKKLVIK